MAVAATTSVHEARAAALAWQERRAAATPAGGWAVACGGASLALQAAATDVWGWLDGLDVGSGCIVVS